MEAGMSGAVKDLDTREGGVRPRKLLYDKYGAYTKIVMDCARGPGTAYKSARSNLSVSTEFVFKIVLQRLNTAASLAQVKDKYTPV